MRNTAPASNASVYFFWNCNGIRNKTQEIFAVVDFTTISIKLVVYVVNLKKPRVRTEGKRLGHGDQPRDGHFVKAGNFNAKNIVSCGNIINHQIQLVFMRLLLGVLRSPFSESNRKLIETVPKLLLYGPNPSVSDTVGHDSLGE